jgi:hypothetical protein
MSMTTTPSRVEGDVVTPLPTLGWALRRAMLALLILSVTVATAAWLLYASIDPSEEAMPAAKTPVEQQQSLPADQQGQAAAPQRA